MDANAAERRQLIAFRVAEQEFGVDIMSIREIRGWTQTTPLPRAPSHVLGVINLRGAIVPVLDFAAAIGLANAQPTAKHVVMVVQSGDRLLGMLVDAVSDIVSADAATIQPPPDVARAETRAMVEGMLALEQRLIAVIRLERLVDTAAETEALAA